jgi:hypothetical protein
MGELTLFDELTFFDELRFLMNYTTSKIYHHKKE